MLSLKVVLLVVAFISACNCRPFSSMSRSAVRCQDEPMSDRTFAREFYAQEKADSKEIPVVFVQQPYIVILQTPKPEGGSTGGTSEATGSGGTTLAGVSTTEKA